MAISIGGKDTSGGYGNLPGYENPLGKDAPSWKGGSYDWEGSSKGIDWGSGFDIDKSGMFEKLFGKARNTDKYRDLVERPKSGGFGGAFGGGGITPGSAGQVLENLGVVYPQQHGPMFIPGVEGKGGLGSTIGRIAGTIGGALIGGPVGAVVGGLGGTVGGLFD